MKVLASLDESFLCLSGAERYGFPVSIAYTTFKHNNAQDTGNTFLGRI